MRRARRDRGKPIPVSDLQAIAKFRAELTVYGQLRDEGATHVEATRAVFADDLKDPK
jgi:hypothetical protein